MKVWTIVHKKANNRVPTLLDNKERQVIPFYKRKKDAESVFKDLKEYSSDKHETKQLKVCKKNIIEEPQTED